VPIRLLIAFVLAAIGAVLKVFVEEDQVGLLVCLVLAVAAILLSAFTRYPSRTTARGLWDVCSFMALSVMAGGSIVALASASRTAHWLHRDGYLLTAGSDFFTSPEWIVLNVVFLIGVVWYGLRILRGLFHA